MLLKIVLSAAVSRTAALLALLALAHFPALAQPVKRVGGMRPPVPKYQDPPAPVVVKGLSKELPINMEYIGTSVVHNMDAEGLRRARAAVVGNGKFTDAEFDAMAARANYRAFPPGLATAEKIENSATLHVTGYVQGSFLLPYNGIAEFVHLVWVPLADNPTGLKPEYNDGKDLFFFSMSDAFKVKPPLLRMPRTQAAALNARHNQTRPEPIGNDMLTYVHGRDIYRALRDSGYTGFGYKFGPKVNRQPWPRPACGGRG